MSKFEDIIDGEPVTIKYRQALKLKGATINLACCDCGLVHNVVILPFRTRLKLYMWRDNRRTANHRRMKKR